MAFFFSLDTRTMLVLVCVASAAMALAIVLVRPTWREGIGLWALGLAANAVAYALLAMRGQISAWLSVVLANIFLSLTVALLLAAVHEFYKRPLSYLQMALPVLVIVFLIAIFLDDYSARMQVTSFVLALQIGLVVRVLQQSQEAQKKRGAMLIRVALEALSLLLLARGLWFVLNPPSADGLLHGDVAQNLTSLMVYVVLVLVSLGFVLLTKERSEETNLRLAQVKSEFLATMSHEIRTPLNAIIGLAQMSLRRSLLPQQQQGSLEKIQHAGQHLLGVINNILDFSRIEGGSLPVEAVPFAPQQLLEDVRVLLMDKAGEKGLSLQAEANPDLPVLLGDPLRIRQILFNFASNAIKFSERGVVQLRLWLEQERGQSFLCAEVSDQGIGLNAEEIAGLFQPFQQADATISRRYGGTGLGLAISRSLAELLGGSVGVRSQPGAGSTFWLRVAVQPAPPGAVPVAADAAIEPVSTAPLRGLRALLVDDNDLNRLVGCELLADAGIRCDEAEDGQQAIDLLAQAADGTYGVVLMDMMMPGLDGCAVTRLLRRNPRFARLPIIAMTANASEQAIEACLAAGMQALVPKPVDAQVLWSTLLAHCEPAQDGPLPCVGQGQAALHAAPDSPLVLLGPLEGFDLSAAVERLDHDVRLYGKLARMFTTRPHDDVARIRQALAADDRSTARLHLHTLQGQAATLGATALQQLAAQVQRAVMQHSPVAELEPQLAQLATRLDDDVQRLQSVLAQWTEAAEQPPSPASPQPHAPRLLVVDDQASSAQVLQDIFLADCAVTVAHSGQQALACCQNSSSLPDLILLDIAMPGMGGLEVCRRLKADPLTADIPVLFITAQATPQEEAAALAAGGVDFITKPVHYTVVRARVQTHLTLKAQRDELHRHAMLDGLTGIVNRRRFDEALAQEWRNGERWHKPLALCMIDIDHFKAYNDHYGHLAGDACLQTIARTLQSHLGRAHDLAARYGGEEFACLLTDIQPADAWGKAQALCQAIAALQLPHAASPTAPYVTISVGVAIWPFDQPGTAQRLVAAADGALYAAKHAGRNRAMLHTEENN